MIIHST